MKMTSKGTKNVKLDKMCKSLMSIDYLALECINGLFKQTYSKDTNIKAVSTEFTTKDYTEFRVDYVGKITNGLNKIYHIEFQTVKDTTMNFRMFNYGYLIANNHKENDKLVFPSQYVIYLEENVSVPNILSVDIETDKGKLKYKVPTLKLWKIKQKNLIRKGLVVLMPLKIFELRNEFRKNSRRKEGTLKAEDLKKLFKKLKGDIKKIAEALFGYYENDDKLNIEDLDKLFYVMDSLAKYLYREYNYQKFIGKEVTEMLESMIKPTRLRKELEKGRLEGKLETTKELLLEYLIGKLGFPKNDSTISVISNETSLDFMKSLFHLAMISETKDEFLRKYSDVKRAASR
jgi:hypothetical protein